MLVRLSVGASSGVEVTNSNLLNFAAITLRGGPAGFLRLEGVDSQTDCVRTALGPWTIVDTFQAATSGKRHI